MLIDNHLTPHSYVLSKGRRGLCVLIAYQRGGGGVRLSKGRRGVRTDVPIKGEEGLFVLMCLAKARRGCVYSCAYQRGRGGCLY